MPTDNVIALDDHRPKPQRGGNNKGTRRRFGNVRKLPSKRFQASYLGPDGIRHNAPVTFLTKGDAETWLAMESAAITEHRWKPAPPPGPSSRTFGDYADEWLEKRTKLKPLKPRTAAGYRHLLDAKILPTFKDVPLADLTPEGVEAWFLSLDPAKATTRGHAYSLMWSVCQSAMQGRLIPANPCQIENGSRVNRAHNLRPASPAEVNAIADAMPDRYRLMVHMAAWCALRFGELTELRRRDLDLDGGVIRVRRAVTWIKGETDAVAAPIVGTPKSDAGQRDVTIPPHLVKPIREHVKAWAQPGPDGLVFPNTEGEHMHHGSLYKVFKPARVKAGRPDLRWHDLRHTGATLAAQAGATTRELMDRLGHSSPAMAMRYQHVADGRAAEIARRLSELAKG